MDVYIVTPYEWVMLRKIKNQCYIRRDAYQLREYTLSERYEDEKLPGLIYVGDIIDGRHGNNLWVELKLEDPCYGSPPFILYEEPNLMSWLMFYDFDKDGTKISDDETTE